MSAEEDNSTPWAADGIRKRTLAARIAALSPEQRALYLDRCRKLGKKSQESAIPRRKGLGPWPASTDQTALWFIQQLQPETAAYNIGNGFRLKGDLEVPLLERCLNDVVSRHEILRTTFKAIDGRPFQVIAPTLKLVIPVTDLRGTSDPESAAHAAVAQWIIRPFDLEKGPLVRLPVVRIDDNEYVVVAVLHHTVTDWWSYHLLYGELFGLYQAFVEGQAMPMPELPIQYADWAVWRNHWQQSDAFRVQEAYWLQQLREAPTILELPADRPRPPIQSYHGKREFFMISPELAHRLRAINQRAATTSFMTLLASVNAFLSRYTGQKDFLIGTPVSADRDREETSHLIGYLLNTLVLRANLAGNPNFLQLLERTRTTCIDAFAHKDFPFRDLVDRLRPERDLSRMPLYQVEYIWISEDSPLKRRPFDLPGFEISAFQIDRMTSPVDLQVAFTEASHHLKLTIEYNTDIFYAQTICRMGAQLISFLEVLFDRPEGPIASLPLLAWDERHRVLEDFNPMPRSLPKMILPELFETQVTRNPGGTAVSFAGESLCYAELNARANRLAHYLLGLGVGPEVLVGIALQRSVELIVALLAVLKAGGAYMPLDPDYPGARLAQMLADAAPALVLSSEALRTRLPQDVEVSSLDGPKHQAALAHAPTYNPSATERATRILPHHSAYVIYTSGSTGIPKGVVVEHQALSAFLAAMRLHLSLGPGDRHLAVTTIGFDISILELFLPLSNGAEVVLATTDETRDPVRLSAFLRTRQVNSLQATPCHWDLLIQQDPGCLQNICILAGGETLSRELARALHEQGSRVYNLYGPTEATIWASAHALTDLDVAEEAPGVVSIGRPLASHRIYLLDHRLELVTIGMTGELYVAGAGLARGYLRRPALTAERFLPDPHAMLPGMRMYRTGDLARWRSDGTLQFLGRADHQVKVRGFRIELGEVETWLARAPGVQACAVMAWGEAARDRHLAAYVVPTDPQVPPTASALQRFLRQHLPDFMAPAAFVWLAQLPLGPTGKLDRRALPAPEARKQPPLGETSPLPRSETERCIAAVWREVLGLERAGIHDSFFELGGNSLLLLPVQWRLQRLFNRRIPMLTLFRHPTIALLAEVLATEPGGPGGQTNELAVTSQRSRDDRRTHTNRQQRTRLQHRRPAPNPSDEPK
jgi:amino acid adenylation domain-containing protein